LNFSQLYTDRLDEELGADDSTRLFTTARRKFGINEGIRQFADLTECFTKESSVSCSNGVGEYDVLSTVNTPAGDFIYAVRMGVSINPTDFTTSLHYEASVGFIDGTSIEADAEYMCGIKSSGGGSSYAGTTQYFAASNNDFNSDQTADTAQDGGRDWQKFDVLLQRSGNDLNIWAAIENEPFNFMIQYNSLTTNAGSIFCRLLDVNGGADLEGFIYAFARLSTLPL